MPTLRIRRGTVSGAEGGADRCDAGAVLLMWWRFGDRTMANPSAELEWAPLPQLDALHTHVHEWRSNRLAPWVFGDHIVQIVTRSRRQRGAPLAGGRIVDERRLADRRVISIQSKPDETSRSVGLDLAAD